MDAMSYLIMLQQLDQLMQIDQQDSGYHLVVLVTQMQKISIPNGKSASWIILPKDLPFNKIYSIFWLNNSKTNAWVDFASSLLFSLFYNSYRYENARMVNKVLKLFLRNMEKHMKHKIKK